MSDKRKYINKRDPPASNLENSIETSWERPKEASRSRFKKSSVFSVSLPRDTVLTIYTSNLRCREIFGDTHNI